MTHLMVEQPLGKRLLGAGYNTGHSSGVLLSILLLTTNLRNNGVCPQGMIPMGASGAILLTPRLLYVLLIALQTSAPWPGASVPGHPVTKGGLFPAPDAGF